MSFYTVHRHRSFHFIYCHHQRPSEMASSWIDIFSFVTTTLFFFGSILGVLYAARAISLRFQSMKTALEDKGITLSREGVSLKTDKRFDRETYVDTTQRGLVKVLGSATVGSEANKRTFLPSSPSADATSSGHGYRKLGRALHKLQGDQHTD